MRRFDSGASRDNVEGKLNYRACLDWGVLQAFLRYMDKHRHTADGVRAWDNWKRGMPIEVYADSLTRHVIDVILLLQNEGEATADDIEEALGGVLFNAMGLWREVREERACEDAQDAAA